jgi:hypothetical protein
MVYGIAALIIAGGWIMASGDPRPVHPDPGFR